jgi:hypothetical protein
MTYRDCIIDRMRILTERRWRKLALALPRLTTQVSSPRRNAHRTRLFAACAVVRRPSPRSSRQQTSPPASPSPNHARRLKPEAAHAWLLFLIGRVHAGLISLAAPPPAPHAPHDHRRCGSCHLSFKATGEGQGHCLQVVDGAS